MRVRDARAKSVRFSVMSDRTWRLVLAGLRVVGVLVFAGGLVADATGASLLSGVSNNWIVGLAGLAFVIATIVREYQLEAAMNERDQRRQIADDLGAHLMSGNKLQRRIIDGSQIVSEDEFMEWAVPIAALLLHRCGRRYAARFADDGLGTPPMMETIPDFRPLSGDALEQRESLWRRMVTRMATVREVMREFS